MVDVLAIIIGACIIAVIWIGADSAYSAWQRKKADKLNGPIEDLSFKELDQAKAADMAHEPYASIPLDVEEVPRTFDELNPTLVSSTPTAVNGAEMYINTWSDSTTSITKGPLVEWVIEAEDEFITDTGILEEEAPEVVSSESLLLSPSSIVTPASVGAIPPAPPIKPQSGFTPPA